MIESPRPTVVLDRVRIASTGSAVPKTVVTNQSIAARIPIDTEWVVANLGIRERRVAKDEECTSDLAAAAGLSALEAGGIDKDSIDLLVLATATPDRVCPSTACIVQEKIGIRNRCAAFDIAAVCSGFLYALTVAANLIQTGSIRRALVIGADTFSKITDWSDRSCVFFGDGAGAVVVERTDGGGFFSSLLYADGAGKDCFTVPQGKNTFLMDGRAVFATATDVLPRAIRQLLDAHKVSLTDVAAIVPHQSSLRVIRRTAEVLGVPLSQLHMNLGDYANTAGATVPLLLDELNVRRVLKPGDWVVFAAVGAGWTWGTALYRWI